MLQLSATITQRRVLSLRTGTTIATVISPIINPDKLVIEGFYCHEPDHKQPLVLLCQDVRETLPGGFVINDVNDLAEPDDLIRMQNLLSTPFNLLHLPVETISGDKVGKVNDFAFETASMIIKKLYVTQSLIKHLTSGSLSVDRGQIHEVTPKKIIIQDLLSTVGMATVAPVS